MSDYVPTIDEMRDRYADARVGIGEWTRFDGSVKRAVEDAYAEFDRRLAEYTRENQEEAWEQGHAAFEQAWESDHHFPYDYATDNPYREEKNDE